MKANLIALKDESMLQTFYDENAFVRNGLLPNDDNIKTHMELLSNYLDTRYRDGEKFIPMYVVKGSMMNRAYGLSGKNAFESDYTMIITPRNVFAYHDREGFDYGLLLAGGAWFQNIVDYRLRKEHEERLIVWSDEPIDD